MQRRNPKYTRESGPRGPFRLAPSAVDSLGRELVLKLCRDILAPLVRIDGGQLHLVGASSESVHIHLTGNCAGCPGASLTRDKIFLPILRGVLPKVEVIVTTGSRIPFGAVRVD